MQMNDAFAAMGTFGELDPPWRVEFSWGWAPGAGQAVPLLKSAPSQHVRRLLAAEKDAVLRPGVSSASMLQNPAAESMLRAFSTPHIAPRPAPPPASDTVMQCMRLMP